MRLQRGKSAAFKHGSAGGLRLYSPVPAIAVFTFFYLLCFVAERSTARPHALPALKIGILDEIQEESVCQEFLKYKLDKSHLSKKDEAFFRCFINNWRYEAIARRTLEEGYAFYVPKKRMINKIGSNKKRVVYTFTEEENMDLKIISFLLYTSNCYSFSLNYGAKRFVNKKALVKNTHARSTLLAISIQL